MCRFQTAAKVSPKRRPRAPPQPYKGHLDNKNQFLSHTGGGIDTGVPKSQKP